MKPSPSHLRPDRLSLSKQIHPYVQTIRQKESSDIDGTERQVPLWRRILLGGAYVSLGTLAMLAGLASISYRLTHMTIDGALVNGRAVRIQAPVDGKIKNFYARPGARVETGQVLALLMPLSQPFQSQHYPTAPTSETPSTAINSQGSVATNSSPSQASVMPLLAPSEGVVYSTTHEGDEQVNRFAVLLSLLDCNQLWVDTLMTRDQAQRIDASQPVHIRQADRTETVVSGQDSITIMSVEGVTKARSEALIPPVPADLSGLSLVRVRVNMPFSQSLAQSHQFCYVGESAQLTFGAQTKSMRFLNRLFRF